MFDFILTRSGIDLVSNNKHELFELQKKGNEYYFINGLLLCSRFFIYQCKYSEITSHIKKWSIP